MAEKFDPIAIAQQAAAEAAKKNPVLPIKEFFGLFAGANYEVRVSKAGKEYNQYYIQLVNSKSGKVFPVYVPRFIAEAAANLEPGAQCRIIQKYNGVNADGYKDYAFEVWDVANKRRL